MSMIFVSHIPELRTAYSKNKVDTLNAVGLEVAGKAKEFTPVVTGRLRSSITHAVQGDTRVDIGTNVFYARFIHEGTGIYSDDPQSRKTPWVYPAQSKGGLARDSMGRQLFVWTQGNRPNKFLERAAAASKERVERLTMLGLKGELPSQ